MNIHVRIVGMLWVLLGTALGAYAVWGLIVEEHSMEVVESWLMVLAVALASIAAGITLGRAGRLGRVLIRLVSIVALLYAATWLLLGGVEDAGGYWPVIVFCVALSVYALFASRRALSAA